MMAPYARLSATVLDTPNPQALGAFYARLLGWETTTNDPEWVMITPQDGGAGLSSQLEENYIRPVWPTVPGEQQMMRHLDISVHDLEHAVAWATDAGATEAGFQPQDHVRVMLDPDGHPFCLFRSES